MELLGYIGSGECVPQLGGRRVGEGEIVLIDNRRAVEELLATRRWKRAEEESGKALRRRRKGESGQGKSPRLSLGGGEEIPSFIDTARLNAPQVKVKEDDLNGGIR